VNSMIQLPLELDVPTISMRAGRGLARQILLDDGVLHYGFQRGPRRTLSIVLGRAGIEVRAPRWVAMEQVEQFIRDKQSWIRRRLSEMPVEARKFRWDHGESLPVLGQTLPLQVLKLATTPRARRVYRVDDRLVACVQASDGPDTLRAAVIAWLRETSLHWFEGRVAHYSGNLGVPLPRVRLSNARMRWGSGHASGRISLSWRLIHMPPRLIDYVVAHEIAHLKEMNHSPRFWALVEQLYPGCRQARRELNTLEKSLPNL